MNQNNVKNENNRSSGETGGNDRPGYSSDRPRFSSDRPRFSSDRPRSNDRPSFSSDRPRFSSEGSSDRPRSNNRPKTNFRRGDLGRPFMNSNREFRPDNPYKPGPFGAKPRFTSDRPSISDLIDDFKVELNKLRTDINSLLKVLNPLHVSTTQSSALDGLTTQNTDSSVQQSTQEVECTAAQTTQN